MYKAQVAAHFDQLAAQRSAWFQRNYIYHEQIIQSCRPFIHDGVRVLELGCSTGGLLSALQPTVGVGVDISTESITIARQNHPQYQWIVGDAEALPTTAPFDEPFDVIILSDLIGYVEDVQTLLEALRRLCKPSTRIVISLWNWLWQPMIKAAEAMQIKTPDLHRQNWLSTNAIKNLLTLTHYETVTEAQGLLLPAQVPVLTPLANMLSYAPLLRRLTLLHTVVARPQAIPVLTNEPSVTVVIPTRNEKGNIAALVERTPNLGSHTELLFIDGNSTDGTIEEIHAQIALHPERDIKFMPQVPPQSPDADTPPNLMLKLGKGDAVRKAFAAAQGDILMILDSDISVPPEELIKFYNAIAQNKGRFINGTRFNYQQQAGAMKPVNMFGNVFFSFAFSWLLGQRLTDTLCGTKVLFKKDYDIIAANRQYFGDFDPFGDFDLLFGAARLGLPIVEVPIHYQARQYGESKVRVTLHGPLLGRMCLFALWQFKIRPLFGDVPTTTPQPEGVPTPKADWSWVGWLVALGAVVLWGISRLGRK